MAEKNAISNIILALDTSVNHCSVSLLCNDSLIIEKYSVMQKGQSEKLLPFIEQTLDESNLPLKSVKAIGVGVGPGNFTGLRIGISAAKGLAMALKIKAFGVSRFENLIESDQPTLALIKNQSDSFYTQLFVNQKPVQPPVEKTSSEILNERYLPNTIISGDCAIHFSKALSLKPGENDSTPRTEKIGSLALKYLKTGGPAPTPLYMKGPDAKLPKEPNPHIIGPDA